MTFDEKKTAALECLAKTGMLRGNYEPPILRVLWRFNVHVRPPHFSGFVVSALISGGFFALLWGVIMWFLVWSGSGMAPTGAAMVAGIAGALFGLTMAAYYAWGRRKHRLPEWKDLPPKE